MECIMYLLAAATSSDFDFHTSSVKLSNGSKRFPNAYSIL